MRKSIFAKIGAAAVVLTLVTSSLVGGTFAKYTSSTAGTGTAQVAKWAIAFKEGDTTVGDTFSFDLKNTNSEVVTTDDKLAPGSEGEIKFVINGTGSEVGYTYSAEADVSGLNGVPIKFYSDSARTTELTPTNDKIAFASTDVTLDKVGDDQTIDIFWAWSTLTDKADTTQGTTGTTGTIKLAVTAEQLVTNTTPTP